MLCFEVDLFHYLQSLHPRILPSFGFFAYIILVSKEKQDVLRLHPYSGLLMEKRRVHYLSVSLIHVYAHHRNLSTFLNFFW